jgi:beta-glucosidase
LAARYRQAGPAFRDPSLPFAKRAADLLGRLTGDEKIAMLHQRALPVPRLAVGEFFGGAEGVHGAAWRDHLGTGATLPATVFPQPPGLAATWDPGLVRDVGRATARELRALHDMNPVVGLNVWAPVVNLLRDPRWGRNEEAYSEDPLLTAIMGTAFCRGLSGDRDDGYLLTAPTLKHFLGYNNEDYRDLTSSALRPRVLRECELPPFRAPIEARVATGVMPSYNLVNGRPAHVSPLLRLIRTWTDDELLTFSDAWAPSNLVNTERYFEDHPRAHAAALRAGLDSFTDQDAEPALTMTAIRQALDRGLITMADVDRAVRRKLLMRLRLGEFDPDGGPYAQAGAFDTAQHRELTRTAARRSMVLLRNEGGLLPIGAARTIAVLGPLADTLCEDWYSPALPYRVTIADGLTAAAGGGTVITDEAAERVRTDLGEFDVFDWGDVITLRSAGAFGRWNHPPDPLGEDDPPIEMGGKYLTVTRGGALAIEADRPDGWTVRETFRRIPQPGGDVLLRSVATGGAVRLRWDVIDDGITRAAAKAREADVAVVVVGNNPLIGARESVDRTTLALPPSMDRLVRAVTAANPRTVLVIMSSYPYTTPGAPAIVWTCHAGQETGHALADLLTGRHAPQGRLTQTWYASDRDLPAPLDYDIIKSGWTYQYFPAEPRYPFGHGLTYTRFGYGALTLTDDDPVIASLDVTNTGDCEGTEVVQLYARYDGPGRPRRRLCGFARVTLAPGETRPVTIPVPRPRLELWDVAAGRMSVPPGVIDIMAGASSADIRQTATLTVPGESPPRTGPRLAAADFDDYENITLVDTTREDGDSVTPAVAADGGWLVFENCLFPERAVVASFRVACAVQRGGRIELLRGCRDQGLDRAALLGAVTVPCTGGRYEWTEVTAPLSAPFGAGDLYLVVHGPVRLDWCQLQ